MTSPRAERLAVAAGVAVGAGLMLLSVSRPWVHATLQDALAGRLTVDADGRQAAPVVAAVALVALAGAIAVLTLRTIGRFVAGLLLVVSGTAAAAAALDVVRSPSDALRSAVSDVTGRTGEALPAATQTVWPWVAVAGAVLVALGGVLAVVRARRWGGLSGRYDAPAAGKDGRTSPRGDGSVETEAGADVRGEARGPGDPWDQLSRGEDPTA